MMVGSYYMEGPLSDALDTYMAGVIFTASLSLHCQTSSLNGLINHLCHSLSIPSLKLLSTSCAAVFCQCLGVLTRGCKCGCRGAAEPEKGLIGFNEHHRLWMLMRSMMCLPQRWTQGEAGSVYHQDQAFLWPSCLGCFSLGTFHVP